MKIFGIERLPEDCIAHVISFTSPRDACRFAAISSTFYSAAVSDTVWERFLPPDYQALLDRSADPIDPSSSKRYLFFRLYDWVLLDDGRMGVRLEKSSRAKCFMLSARAITIIWGDDPRYWRWIPVADSRFSEAAELIRACWLEIHGKIQSNILTSNTIYAAFLVFKLTSRSPNLQYSHEASIALGLLSSTKIVRLEPNNPSDLTFLMRSLAPVDANNDFDNDDDEGEAFTPRVRVDGWMEISMGRFYNEGEDGEVAMSFTSLNPNWKSGLIVLGIEIRPTI